MTRWWLCVLAARSRLECCWGMRVTRRTRQAVTFWTTWVRWSIIRPAASSLSPSVIWSVLSSLLLLQKVVESTVVVSFVYFIIMLLTRVSQVHFSVHQAWLSCITDCHHVLAEVFGVFIFAPSLSMTVYKNSVHTYAEHFNGHFLSELG